MNGYELKIVLSAKYLEPRYSVWPTAYKPDYIRDHGAVVGTTNLPTTPPKSARHARQMLQRRFFYLPSWTN